MVEHDMGVVFDLADRISVLVYGEIIATDTPGAHPRERGRAGGLPRDRASMLEVDDAARLLRQEPHPAGDHRFASARARSSACSDATAPAARPRSRRSWARCAPVGAIRFNGERIDGLKPHEIARRGLGYVPEDREIFPDPDRAREPAARHEVERHRGLAARWSLDDMFALFPLLSERADTPGGVLSGGEQQMLTICRTLMGDPELIMVDEPTEGLAPKIVELVRGCSRRSRERGIAILLIEQKLTIALAISQRRLCDGPRPHRVRRHRRGAARQRRGAQGMAGGLSMEQ